MSAETATGTTGPSVQPVKGSVVGPVDDVVTWIPPTTVGMLEEVDDELPFVVELVDPEGAVDDVDVDPPAMLVDVDEVDVDPPAMLVDVDDVDDVELVDEVDDVDEVELVDEVDDVELVDEVELVEVDEVDDVVVVPPTQNSTWLTAGRPPLWSGVTRSVSEVAPRGR